MRNKLVRCAVLAAIATAASSAADAASYTLHISGASAQRTFWESDLEAITNGTYGSGTGCTLIATTASLNPPVPDLHSLTCTVTTHTGGPALPAGVFVGDSITLNYEAEFGSVWGIAPFIPGSNAAATGRRSVTNATVTGYSRDLDTATAGLSAPTPIDIGVSDAEPIFWALPDNWSYSDGLNVTGPTRPR